MSDLLTTADLENAKKHDTFHSEVITGKEGGLSTGADIEYATNEATGQVQKTLPATIDEVASHYGWIIVGTFAGGFTISSRNEVGQDSSGAVWRYTGSLPFSVQPGTTPLPPTYEQLVETDHNELTNRDAADAHSASSISRNGSNLDLDLTAIESSLLTAQTDIQSLQAGQNAGVISYATLAELEADLDHAEGVVAYVTNDGANNGIYRKVGASGTGSWSKAASTIPPGTVSRTELVQDFSFNGQIAASADLNSIRQDGVYYGAAGGGFANMPPDFTGAFVLDVREAFDGNGNFLMQVMRDFNNQLFTWVRRLSGGGGAGSWQREYQNELMLTKGQLDNGASTQDADEDGIYFLSSTRTFADMPTGAAAADYVISVNEAFFTSPGRFKNQRMWLSSDPNKAWTRRLDKNGAATQNWSLVTTADAAVSRDQLSANYGDKGILSSGSANDVTEDGSYLILNTDSVSDLPTGIGSGILTVTSVNGGNWGYQEFSDLFNGGNKHRRMTRPGNGTVSEWQGMPSSEMTIACFGDSITENGTYPQQLSQLLGGKVLKMGFGGCRMANHEDAGYNAMCMNNISQNIRDNDYTSLIAGAIDVRDRLGDDNVTQAELVRDTDWSAVDYVVLFWGTNDYAADIPLGTTSDTTGATFLGAINKTITNLLTAYPNLQILVVTPFWRPRIISGDGKESDTFPNNNGDFLIDFGDALIERSNAYHVNSLDFYRTSGINPLTQYRYLGAGDDIHPNTTTGYQHVANKIAASFRSSF